MATIKAKVKVKWRKPISQERLIKSQNSSPKHPNSKRTKSRGNDKYLKSFDRKARIIKKGKFSNNDEYKKFGAYKYASLYNIGWLESAHKRYIKNSFEAGNLTVYNGLIDAQKEIMGIIYRDALSKWPVFTGNMITSVYSAIYKNGKIDMLATPDKYVRYKKPRSRKLTSGSHVDKNGYQWAYLFKDARKKGRILDDYLINTTGNYAYEDAIKILDEAVNYIPYNGKSSIPKKTKQYALKIAFGAEYAKLYEPFNATIDKLGTVYRIVNKHIQRYIFRYMGTNRQGK